MANFAFTTREEYLAFRADWRAKYKALTLAIRANKQEQRTTADTSTLQSNLYYLRVSARKMMAERTAATEYKNNMMAEAVAEAA
jgi:hypothetical protein